MSKKPLVLWCLLLATSVAFARSDQLIVDQYISPYAGTALNLSIFHTYTYLDDRFLPSSQGKEDFLWATARIGKLIVEDWLSQFLMVLQHEVFGHGYRLREFGFKHITYYISIGHGGTGLSSAQEWHKVEALPWPKQASISAAGMEANAVLSQQIRQNWFMQGKIDRREAIFYWITSLDQADYIWVTTDESTKSSNDVNAYVNEINAWYNDNYLTKSKLRNFALVDLIDPNLYLSAYSLAEYILNGAANVALTTFDIYGFKYLFLTRLLLAPYGPEFQLQNYVLSRKQMLWQVNLRYGNNSHIQSYGFDVLTKPIWHYKNCQFGNKLYLWRQPNFLQQNTASAVHNSLGIAELLSAEYRFNKYFSALGELGYKTAGYIQGIPLGNSWVWRLGISLTY